MPGATQYDPGMFAMTSSDLPVPDDLKGLFRRSWDDLAAPGTWWGSEERVAIAAVARRARVNLGEGAEGLPTAANEAAQLIASAPATATQGWVERMTAALGVGRFVELTGAVSSVVGIDTVTQLLGCEPEPLPLATGGEARNDANVKGRQGRAWVPLTGPPLPRFALSAVPRAQKAVVALLDRLYVNREQQAVRDNVVRGLHRTQIELVATTVSHGNGCFY